MAKITSGKLKKHYIYTLKEKYVDNLNRVSERKMLSYIQLLYCTAPVFIEFVSDNCFSLRISTVAVNGTQATIYAWNDNE